MNKKIALVTGATGFVGSHLVKRLINEKYTVHVLVRESSDTSKIKDVLPKVYVHIVSLEDKQKLTESVSKIKPAYIFHLATNGLFSGIEKPFKEILKTNVLGTINLIEACNNIPYKCFVNTGSSSEYGEKEKIMTETDVCFPQSSYALSKLTATLFCVKTAKENKKPIVTLRLFSPFGANDDNRRLIPYVIQNAKENKPISLSSPDSVRDYIYIKDVVDAYLACIKNAKKISGEIINIGSGKEYSIKEIVAAITSLTNSKSKIAWNSNKNKRFESTHWQANIRKAKKLLDWTPKYSFKQGLKEIM
ncbi:MAG TPA: NAD-dependent epimerase/dehydratase family protein [Patescibacteria group bacterium]